MSKISGDPQTFLREALELSDQVIDRPRDERLSTRLAIKVQALAEAIDHGDYKIVLR